MNELRIWQLLAFIVLIKAEVYFVCTSAIGKNFIFSIRSLYLFIALTFLSINTGRAQLMLDSYSNNFNSPSDDFEGNGFSILTPDDFENPAIHTVHPYPHSPSTTRDTVLYYTLKHSIRVNASNPSIVFDEVLLSGDIVRVQAFSIKSNTWITLASYTSSNYSPWVLRLNSLVSGWDSKATGSSSLYRQREVNLLTNPAIKPGDEIKIRFCLFSNWIGNAWGWAIDNLKIQPDEVPPYNQTLSHSIMLRFLSNKYQFMQKCKMDLVG
jgi:hypothetical protein